jgi:hypothetical protein
MVEALGIETPDTSSPCVVLSGEKVPERATQDDARRREVSALSAPGDPVEAALAQALGRAAEAGRFDVVAQLAREVEARRLARATSSCWTRSGAWRGHLARGPTCSHGQPPSTGSVALTTVADG